MITTKTKPSEKQLQKTCLINAKTYDNLVNGLFNPNFIHPIITAKINTSASIKNTQDFNIYYQKNNVVVSIHKNRQSYTVELLYVEKESSKDIAYLILREILRQGGKEIQASNTNK